MRTAAFLLATVFISGVFAQTPKKYAFVVGVNKYQRRGFDELRFPENDAKELAAALRKLRFEVVELRGEAATRQALETQLLAMLKPATQEDVILVFLAGHVACSCR